jgi:hypothetical protein
MESGRHRRTRADGGLTGEKAAVVVAGGNAPPSPRGSSE